jgi:circadian clock protein KaiB
MSGFQLTLYVTGSTSRSERAIANLHRICESGLRGDVKFTVVDVLEHPQLAEKERVMATPTLIRELPLPTRRIIGDLSDNNKVLEGLGLTRLAGLGRTKS